MKNLGELRAATAELPDETRLVLHGGMGLGEIEVRTDNGTYLWLHHYEPPTPLSKEEQLQAAHDEIARLKEQLEAQRG